MATDNVPTQNAQVVTAADVPADNRHGADIRALLGPKSVGSTTGFMGVANIAPGERIREHYHPYSEEFIYLVRGSLDFQLNGESTRVNAGQAIMIPINVRHRLVNDGDEEAELVFAAAPLAPDPKLGHVATE